MKLWNLSKQMWFLSSWPIGIMIFVGMVSFSQSKKLVGHIENISNFQVPVLRSMVYIDMMHDGLRGNAFSSLLVKELNAQNNGAEILKEHEEMAKNIKEHMNEVYNLEKDEDILKKIKQVEPLINDYIKVCHEIVTLSLNGNRLKAQEHLPKLGQTFKDLENELEELGNVIEKHSQAVGLTAKEDSRYSLYTNSTLIIFGSLFSILSAAFFIGLSKKKLSLLIKELSDVFSSTNSTASEVQANSENLFQSNNAQASAIEETVAAMEEITAMVSQNEQNAGRSLNISNEGVDRSSVARKSLESLTDAIKSIENSNSRLDEIVKVIKEIESKTNIINDIVTETRLLSFNASIEAARAGVHGRGFAVVAEEVGNLASMSGKAADEIRGLLENSNHQVTQILKGTNESVTMTKSVAKEFEQSFRQVGDSLNQISDAVKMIHVASKEQDVGIKQTNQAMHELDRVTQTNTRATQDLSTSAGNLIQNSKQLQDVIVKLNVIVGSEVSDSYDKALNNPTPVAASGMAHTGGSSNFVKKENLLKMDGPPSTKKWKKTA